MKNNDNSYKGNKHSKNKDVIRNVGKNIRKKNSDLEKTYNITNYRDIQSEDYKGKHIESHKNDYNNNYESNFNSQEDYTKLKENIFRGTEEYNNTQNSYRDTGTENYQSHSSDSYYNDMYENNMIYQTDVETYSSNYENYEEDEHTKQKDYENNLRRDKEYYENQQYQKQRENHHKNSNNRANNKDREVPYRGAKDSKANQQDTFQNRTDDAYKGKKEEIKKSEQIVNPLTPGDNDYKKSSGHIAQVLDESGGSLSGVVSRVLTSPVEGMEESKHLREAKENISFVSNTFVAVMDIENNIKRGVYPVRGVIRTAGDGVRYIKGVEKKGAINHEPVTLKQHKEAMKEFGELNSLTSKYFNKEFNKLQGLEKIGELTKENQEKLKQMVDFTKMKSKGEKLSKGLNAKSGMKRNFKNVLRSIDKEGENAALQQLNTGLSVITNQHVRKLAKYTTIGLGRSAKSIGELGVMTVNHYSHKTGLDVALKHQVNLVKHSDTGQSLRIGVNNIKKGINGAYYQKGKDNLLKMTPKEIKGGYNTVASGIRTAKEKGSVVKTGLSSIKERVKQSKLGKFSKGAGKVAGKVGKAVTAPIRVVKALAAGIIKGYLAVALGVLILFTTIAVFISLFTTIFTVFTIEKDDVQRYVSHIEGLQIVFEQELERDIQLAMERYDSIEDPTWNYTHSSDIDNMKEIMSMSAVYLQQEWPKFIQFIEGGKAKTYIEDLFNNSHFYQIVPGDIHHCSGCTTRIIQRCERDEFGELDCVDKEVPDCEGHQEINVNLTLLGFDEIFEADKIGKEKNEEEGWNGWDDGNIEWAKVFFEQDWFELYGVSVGFEGSYDPLTPEELEELMKNLPEDLDQVRKDIVTSALSAQGVIPYYWNWRDLGAIKPGLSGNSFGATVKKDDFGVRDKKGLDCSGFIVWAHWTAGINPQVAGWGNTANTSAIYNSRMTREIDKSQLKVGDLGMIQKKSGEANHVGIYLGDNMWVHCSPRGGVITSTYNSFKIFLRLDFLD